MVFDAHEYFTEVPEVIHRPFVKWIWQMIEKNFIPMADECITVNQSLADLFSKKYDKPFIPIYNVPEKSEKHKAVKSDIKPYLLYQGMLNYGRGLEELMAAMPYINDMNLIIIGEGDISEKLKRLANESPAKDRIRFTGWLKPDDIKVITAGATLVSICWSRAAKVIIFLWPINFLTICMRKFHPSIWIFRNTVLSFQNMVWVY